MKKYIPRYLAILLVFSLSVLMAIPALASVVENAQWHGIITVTNNGTSDTNLVSTNMSLDSTAFLANNYALSDFSDVVIQANSDDICFMPGYGSNPWIFQTNTVGAGQNVDYDIYSGNVSGGLIRYFPGTGGMTIADNDSSLELGDNFTIEQTGWFDTTAGTGNLLEKGLALKVAVDDATDGTINVIACSDNATSLDIGSAAANYDITFTFNQTGIDTANPANEAGIITSVQIYASTNLAGCRVGTFYLVSGTTYKCRDSETIGAVTAGSVQTKDISTTPLETQAGDFIGYYATGGELEYNTTGGTAIAYVAGEYIDAGDSANYTIASSYKLALYGTGKAFISLSATNVSSGNHTVVTALSDDVLSLVIDNNYAIDVGSPAIDRATQDGYGYTIIEKGNPANHNGTLTSIEVWAHTNLTGFRVGTFYLVSGSTYTCRDSETIGAVTAGSMQSFPVTITVEAGDYIGAYIVTGTVDMATIGGSGAWYVDGEYIDSGDSHVFYNEGATAIFSLYGSYTASGEVAFTGSVPNTDSSWTIGGPATPFIESYKIWIGGNPRQDISWAYGDCFYDASGNTAVPTFRTDSSNANVTAILTSFKPATEAKVTTFNVSGSLEAVPSAPASMSQMYTETPVSGVTGLTAPINALLDAGVVPRDLWWFPFIIIGICIIGLLLYGATATTTRGEVTGIGSMLTMAIVMEMLLVVFGVINILPLWPVELFPIAALAIIFSQKHYSWG